MHKTVYKKDYVDNSVNKRKIIMAVSEIVLKRRDEAMELFRENFHEPSFKVRIRSPKRKGGDREFLLDQADKNIAGIHVKRESYKMYLADHLVRESDLEYARLNGSQFREFTSIDDCIIEIKNTMERAGRNGTIV